MNCNNSNFSQSNLKLLAVRCHSNVLFKKKVRTVSFCFDVSAFLVTPENLVHNKQDSQRTMVSLMLPTPYNSLRF